MTTATTEKGHLSLRSGKLKQQQKNGELNLAKFGWHEYLV